MYVTDASEVVVIYYSFVPKSMLLLPDTSVIAHTHLETVMVGQTVPVSR